MPYRVSTNPSGEQRWWEAGETIPLDHSKIRAARPDEVILMGEIIRQDAAGKVPEQDLGDALYVLMARG